MVQVSVNEGILEGEKVESSIAGTFYSFKGIPYAEPPLGDLRFKAPQPVKPWNGVRSAKQCGPNSYQVDVFIKKTGPSGSEDCLYLNVYTPNLKPATSLPVMFWIHGGGFTLGSGDDDVYGPDFLIRHGIILVTINYRVDVLGFLCLDTKDIPGNAGMKDQVAALKWIKNNIENFGGDPENITIAGESAGGASVAYHLVSPMTKGLFKKAIMQSGAATCWWSLCSAPRERALAFAKKLGLQSEDDTELYEFFKSQPIENLVQVQIPITFHEKLRDKFHVNFSVVSEKKFDGIETFFSGDIIDALQKGIHDGVQVINGYTADEGILGVITATPLNDNIDLANNFYEFFVPQAITYNCSVNERLAVGKKIKKFYFGNEDINMENLEQLVKFFSMEMFVYGITMWQKICAKNGKNKMYFYKFTCKSERNLIVNLLGATELFKNKSSVCHADDLLYMFPFKVINQNIEPESKIFNMIKNVTTLWTNFVKYGNPTPDDSLDVKWTPYTLENENYLDIGEKLVLNSVADKEQIKFWEEIFKQYLPHYTFNASQ